MEIHKSEKIALACTAIFMIVAVIFAQSLIPISYTVSINQGIGANPRMLGDNGLPTVNVYWYAYHADGSLIASGSVHNTGVNNLLTSIKVDLGVGNATGKFLYIAPTNATMTVGATDTYCGASTDKTFVTQAAVAPALGSYTSTGTGTWNVTQTFTLTSAISTVIYGACLQSGSGHGSGSNSLGAEANFAQTATLAAVGDNVKIVWMMTVTTS